jgi:hypothetical protein
MTLDVNLHTASIAAAGATFAKATPDKPPGKDAKAKKTAAVKRKAAAAAATTTTTTAAGTKRGKGTKPPTKK